MAGTKRGIHSAAVVDVDEDSDSTAVRRRGSGTRSSGVRVKVKEAVAEVDEDEDGDGRGLVDKTPVVEDAAKKIEGKGKVAEDIAVPIAVADAVADADAVVTPEPGSDTATATTAVGAKKRKLDFSSSSSSSAAWLLAPEPRRSKRIRDSATHRETLQVKPEEKKEKGIEKRSSSSDNGKYERSKSKSRRKGEENEDIKLELEDEAQGFIAGISQSPTQLKTGSKSKSVKIKHEEEEEDEVENGEEEETQTRGSNNTKRPRKKQQNSSKKVKDKEEKLSLSLSPPTATATAKAIAADLQTKKLKSYAQFAGSRQSPYPDFPRPRPEECELAYEILSRLHGARERPSAAVSSAVPVTAPTNRAGCGDSPSVLDALIRTILSQNTSDVNSTRAKLSMDSVYGSMDAWSAIVEGGQSKLQQAIESGGLAAVKSRVILDILTQTYATQGRYSLDHLFNVSDDEAMRQLISFRGVGPKTASCVLLFCLQRPSFAVDTHVHRITGFLGWRPTHATRDQTYAHLDARIPDHLKYGLHLLIVKHGKVCAECKAGGGGGGGSGKTTGSCELRKAFRKGKMKGEAGEEAKKEELDS